MNEWLNEAGHLPIAERAGDQPPAAPAAPRACPANPPRSAAHGALHRVFLSPNFPTASSQRPATRHSRPQPPSAVAAATAAGSSCFWRLGRADDHSTRAAAAASGSCTARVHDTSAATPDGGPRQPTTVVAAAGGGNIPTSGTKCRVGEALGTCGLRPRPAAAVADGTATWGGVPICDEHAGRYAGRSCCSTGEPVSATARAAANSARAATEWGRGPLVAASQQLPSSFPAGCRPGRDDAAADVCWFVRPPGRQPAN